MGKCIECEYLAIVGGHRLACQGQKYMPYVDANWGCEYFKPKKRRSVSITEDDVKQLTEFSKFINNIIHKLDT